MINEYKNDVNEKISTFHFCEAQIIIKSFFLTLTWNLFTVDFL